MKIITYFIVLLFHGAIYSQSQIDPRATLREKDYKDIAAHYKMMKYLDSISLEYGSLPIRQRDEANKKFYSYYIDTIARLSPAGFEKTNNYLGYKGIQGPMTWEEFKRILYRKNILSIIEMTQKYGYLGVKTIQAKDINLISNVIHVWRDEKYDKQLKKLFKSEYKLGNIDKKEYNQLKFVFKRKTTISESDKKWLWKHASTKWTTK